MSLRGRKRLDERTVLNGIVWRETAVNEALPRLNELLFSSVDGVLVESVEVIDTVVPVETRTTAGRAACSGCGCWSGRIHGSYLRSLCR
ncbi:hypothetical protein GCM10010521_17200 [Streptomyces rameus]|uniref:Uncharacterized protein n=1 Tax=Streptomyces rameus TaxID=68261 RepID=A0ABP6N4L5_9ACTN